MGLFVSVVGILGLIVSGSILKISPILSELFNLSPRLDSSTVRAFLFLLISGILSVSFAVSRDRMRGYRFLGFLSFVFATISLVYFVFKTVNLGPDWLGVELIGREGKTKLLSIGVTLLSGLNFFSTLIGIVLEMSEE